MFVFVVGIGEGVFVCGREWAVFGLVVGIGLSSTVGLGLCLWLRSVRFVGVGQARNSEGRVEKKMDD